MTLFTSAFHLQQRCFVLLAPADAQIPQAFRRVTKDREKHHRILRGLQRLRAKHYLRDGAIDTSQVTSDGRFLMGADEDSWHLVTLDRQGNVAGCLRYLPHSHRTCFERLRVHHSALTEHPHWAQKLRGAVHSELARAWRDDIGYVEISGWAIDDELRGSTEALRMLVGTYAWGRLTGGCLGISTATVRNSSAAILRRIGGNSLEHHGAPIPPYYDPTYKCEMEILRFDSREPNPRYGKMVDDVASVLMNVPVIRNQHPEEVLEQAAQPAWQPSWVEHFREFVPALG